MRFEIYDENNKLFRKFWEKSDAEKFLQDGWSLIVKTKQKKIMPTVKTHGEARW